MDSTAAIEYLATSRSRFLNFVRTRIADPELAEDIVQASLTKAVERFDTLQDQERVVPWFYAILRNAITDAYRQRARSREVELPSEFDTAEGSQAEAQLCQCFRELLPSLRREYADLIESLDLGAEAHAAAARRLGISGNNLKVRHHRARQALKHGLETTCRVCAEHGCLDCTCDSAPKDDSRV